MRDVRLRHDHIQDCCSVIAAHSHVPHWLGAREVPSERFDYSSGRWTAEKRGGSAGLREAPISRIPADDKADGTCGGLPARRAALAPPRRRRPARPSPAARRPRCPQPRTRLTAPLWRCSPAYQTANVRTHCTAHGRDTQHVDAGFRSRTSCIFRYVPRRNCWA